MAKEIILNVQTRTEKDANLTKLRKNGEIPAVMYGNGFENVALKLKKNEFDKILKETGKSTLINLNVDGNSTVQVIVKGMQREVMGENLIHVDFYRVKMDEKIVVEVPLVFVGEPKAVKELGGMLMTNRETVKIKCLPGDLLEHIDVNLSLLDNFSKKIKLSDLQLPENVKVFAKADDLIVSVVKPKKLLAKAADETSKKDAKKKK